MATDADVTGDWLYKSSAFQTRLPMPTAGSSFLDVDALKSLLPGHSRLYSKSQSVGNLLDSAMTGSEWLSQSAYESQTDDELAYANMSAVPETLDESKTETQDDKDADDEVIKVAQDMGLTAAEVRALDSVYEESEESAMDEKYEKAFKACDADKSGTISPKELRFVVERVGDAIDEAELADLMREADTDGDGHINYAEFVQMMHAKKRLLHLASTMTEGGHGLTAST